MKIAVLTMTFNNNYGGLLQAYGLMTYLKKLGHEPELLFVQLDDKSIKSYIKKYIMPLFSNKWLTPKKQALIDKNMRYFIETYITPKTKPIYTEKDFESNISQNYDAYIVGSDQVWRPKMYRFLHHAFFDFVKDEKVLLSYAASFGVDSWEFSEEETLKYKEQIKRFNGVSVREDSGVSLCKKHLETDTLQVLDPTMLLSVKDYQELVANEEEIKIDGELLVYMLDMNNEKESIISFISEKLKLKEFYVNKSIVNNDKMYPSVTSWLNGFINAKYVVTDSFHGCVFSIIFNKPFIVYGNKKRGLSRFNSILKLFHLESRLIHTKSDLNVKKLEETIDWSSVNEKMNKYKKSSMDFLISNLNMT